MTDKDNYRRKIRDELLSEMDFTREYTDEELYALIDEKIRRISEEVFFPLENRKKIRTEVFCGLRKLDILEELLRDRSVTDLASLKYMLFKRAQTLGLRGSHISTKSLKIPNYKVM